MPSQSFRYSSFLKTRLLSAAFKGAGRDNIEYNGYHLYCLHFCNYCQHLQIQHCQWPFFLPLFGAGENWWSDLYSVSRLRSFPSLPTLPCSTPPSSQIIGPVGTSGVQSSWLPNLHIQSPYTKSHSSQKNKARLQPNLQPEWRSRSTLYNWQSRPSLLLPSACNLRSLHLSQVN